MKFPLERADQDAYAFEARLDLSARPEVIESIRLTGPVPAHGELRKAEGAYVLRFAWRFAGELPCARCLEAVKVEGESQAELRLLPRSADVAEDEHRVANDEFDIVLYDEPEVDVDALVAEQILLDLPMKPLCRDDCRGVCPECGADRNQAECSCVAEVDPRWKALADVKGRPS